MPSSRYNALPLVLDIVTAIQPKSILDIGVGFGKYGALFREYLDWWKTDRPLQERSLRLIGIEVFEAYRNPVWGVYDGVHIGDALTLDVVREPYDLVFMGDIIEHFAEEEAHELLDSLNCKHLIIVTTDAFREQEAVYGNVAEIHKSIWAPETTQGFQCAHIPPQYVYYKESGAK